MLLNGNMWGEICVVTRTRIFKHLSIPDIKTLKDYDNSLLAGWLVLKIHDLRERF